MSERERDIIVEDPTLAAGFTQIPNALLRRADLSQGAKVAYMMLLSYSWQEGSCFPGQERLARDMGAGERSVRTYLQELQARGLITIRRRGLNLTNVYILHQFGSANSAGQGIVQDPGSANSADQERPNTPALKRPNLPITKTQSKKTQKKNGRVHVRENAVVDDAPPTPDPVTEYRNMTPEQRLARSEQLERDRKRIDRALRALGT